MSKKKIAALTLLALTVAVSAYAAWLWYSLPDVEFLEAPEPQGDRAHASAREKARPTVGARSTESPNRLETAVIMGEDGGFYGHQGFDLHEIRIAFERNWEEGRTVRGASTITQQLAKNLFLSSERSYGRKLEEALLAHRLEKALSKNRILEIYLNVIEWGDGIYGVEAASRNVLGKSAANLDTAEGALLAAMIPSPLRLQPCERPKSVRARQERILRWMYRANRLTEEEYQSALDARPWLEKVRVISSRRVGASGPPGRSRSRG